MTLYSVRGWFECMSSPLEQERLALSRTPVELRLLMELFFCAGTVKYFPGSIPVATREWVERFLGNQEAALAELFEFILRVSVSHPTQSAVGVSIAPLLATAVASCAFPQNRGGTLQTRLPLSGRFSSGSCHVLTCNAL